MIFERECSQIFDCILPIQQAITLELIILPPLASTATKNVQILEVCTPYQFYIFKNGWNWTNFILDNTLIISIFRRPVFVNYLDLVIDTLVFVFGNLRLLRCCVYGFLLFFFIKIIFQNDGLGNILVVLECLGNTLYLTLFSVFVKFIQNIWGSAWPANAVVHEK